VDPRQQRTTDALRRTILAVAAERPIDQVQVAEIARRAGITRSTFYNQGATPSVLLARYFAEELDAVQREFQSRRTARDANLAEVWADSERDLVEHLLRHSAIYERDLADSAGGHLGPTLRNLLVGHIERSLREHLDSFPRLAETAGVLERDMYAAFVAHGTVGAFEIWLRSPAPRDAEAATRAILHSLPGWWFEPIR
jgi:AcrR family transcriptional regulator